MANPEHLEIVLKGPESINQWRKQHPTERFDLSKANLSSTDLSWASLSGGNLSKANLSNAKLFIARLVETDLSEANLNGAVLIGADLTLANLSRASLSDALLFGVNLYYANLSKVDLSEAELPDTYFYNTILTATNFNKAIFSNVTFANCNLSDCKGLESVIHQGPSSIGIDTLMRSIGAIPKAFLRDAGVPDTIIDFFSSLEEGPRYYTCFISYGSPDADFAGRLYKDLTRKKVRCWEYSESAAIGRGIWANIDRAIAAYDKVIVICSKDSLNRVGVLNEIERALQKEESLHKENARLIKETEKGKKPKLLDEDVLCPVRLDDYVITEWKHPRKADVTKKHIGDFCDWKTNKKKYDLEFSKLLHALDPKSWGPVKDT